MFADKQILNMQRKKDASKVNSSPEWVNGIW